MKSLDELIAAAQNAAQTVQAQMDQAQITLESIEVEGASGGGLVKIRATAKGRIISIDIDESLLKVSEKQMLEDLVVAALNDARGKADAAANAEMSKMTQGLPLPAGFQLPF
jgi:DNA-binding YbaB/EbfC family protein